MWGIHEGFGWWMVVGAVVGAVWMILVWAVIGGLVVWGIKQFTGNRREGLKGKEKPIEIAQNRLARGEISEEQFEGLKKALQ